jgi:dephospho-CoA kinase
MDRIVVVWCTQNQQLERLLARGMTASDALQRIGAQMPLEGKRRLAHDMIDCSGTIAHTREQVAELVARLRQSGR